MCIVNTLKISQSSIATSFRGGDEFGTYFIILVFLNIIYLLTHFDI